jgi:hypothetical protein
MKYLVFKGWLGFGDRLETLKMCVKFALDNNVQLYIDWSDSMWSHGSESFDSYFKLIDVPQLSSLDEIPADASCFPECWNNRLKEPFSVKFFNENPSCNIPQLNPNFMKLPVDVVVVTGIGKRATYIDSSFFAKVFRVTHPTIIEEVKKRQRDYNLKSCLGIHIRGSDRLNKKGREMPIQWMAIHAAMEGGLSGKPMIAVSDDQNSFEIWKRFFPQTKLMSGLSMQATATKGIHNAGKDELKTTKDALNIDCIIDLFTLASCERIRTTYKDSRFYAEAFRLGPFVNTILSS